MQDKDRSILRDLAKQIKELAQSDEMINRKKRWIKHNHLVPGRPMVIVYPENSWETILPPDKLRCEGEQARFIERELMARRWYSEGVFDDTVIDDIWNVSKIINHSIQKTELRPIMLDYSFDWGLCPSHTTTDIQGGSFGFVTTLQTADDLRKLIVPQVEYDEKASLDDFKQTQDLFGDILDVRLSGVRHVNFHLMSMYIHLRGLEQMLYDLYEEPGFVHEFMHRVVEGHQSILKQFEEQNLLSLNNDNSFSWPGGVCFTDELPADGYSPDKVRFCDMWGAAESQEMDPVSPEMHEEFVMQYERKLLGGFGLTAYGCCDNLTHKMDYVFRMPNLRRIAVAPWANVKKCAQKIQKDYVFCWKPNPASLLWDMEAGQVENLVERALDDAQNCILEISLKDTHSCNGEPERYIKWTKIVKRLIDERYS